MATSNKKTNRRRDKEFRKKKSNKVERNGDAASASVVVLASGDSAALLRTKLRESLQWNILNSEAGQCSSSDEIEGTVEVIIDSLFDSLVNAENKDGIRIDTIKKFIVDALSDYLPDFEQCATVVTDRVIEYISGRVDNCKETICEEGNDLHTEDASSSDIDDEDCITTDYDSDEDDNYIQEGECEMCEREVKLTRHHLIPRSTWPRLKHRFLQASSHFVDGDMTKAEEILGMAIPRTLTTKDVNSWKNTKLFLSHYTSNLCKMCHAAVHRRFDNLELAEKRNCVDALMEDEEILKFCKWANKQRPQRRY